MPIFIRQLLSCERHEGLPISWLTNFYRQNLFAKTVGSGPSTDSLAPTPGDRQAAGAGGTVYSIYGVKLLSGNTAQANESIDLLTSSDISIAATYGTDQIIITATVTAGHRVIWDIETTTYENGTVTVAYA